MLQLVSRAQVEMWNLRSRATSTLRNENGEANVFAIIIGILVVAIVMGGIAFLVIKAGQGVTDKAKGCLADPTSCNNQNGITVQ